MKRSAYMTLAAVALVLMSLVPAYAQKRVGGSEVETTIINVNGPIKGDGSPKLVFRCYGNEYFVAAAYLPNADHAHEFVASAAEIQVARNTKQQRVELAMNVEK